MSLRFLLWFAVFLLMAFAGWQFLRALAAARSDSRAAAAVPPAQAGNPDEAVTDDDDAGDRMDAVSILRSPARTAEVPPAAPAAAPAPEVFQLELENQRLRSELAELQALHQRQQSEVGALQNELDALSAQQQPGTSPEYSEALALAGQGLDADVIAQRCGISVAEAELVLSLNSGRAS